MCRIRITRRAPWNGILRRFDSCSACGAATITRDGQLAVYPTPTGFELLTIGTGASLFVPYAGTGPTPLPLPAAVDVLIIAGDENALYPTLGGIEHLDLPGQTSTTSLLDLK